MKGLGGICLYEHSDDREGEYWGVYGGACKCEHKEAGEGAHLACASAERPREGGHWLMCMCM